MGKLDEYHYHEAIDRAHIVNDHFHEYVEKHPVIMANGELKKKAEEVSTLLYSFYNLCLSYAIIKNRATEYEESNEEEI